MPNDLYFVVDTHSVLLDLFESIPYDFYNPNYILTDIIKDAIYVIGKDAFYENLAKVQELITKQHVKIIYCDPFEGSSSLTHQLKLKGVDKFLKQHRVMIITGAELGPEYVHMTYEGFLPVVNSKKENKPQFARINEIYNRPNKPYKFLFLNGIYRWHREYLIERFKASKLIDQSIWSCLDPDQIGLHLLDKKYELPLCQDRSTIVDAKNTAEIKDTLFNGSWGDGIVVAEPYIDTYFSLVTETVTDSYSFRTEKIWKPIAMGHPWIAVANAGYYRDIRNLGFKTFGHVIDESFDLIEDSQQRVERIATIVEELCNSDLDKFLLECRDVCIYNQQHFAEMSTKIQQEFPERFLQFINRYN